VGAPPTDYSNPNLRPSHTDEPVGSMSAHSRSKDSSPERAVTCNHSGEADLHEEADKKEKQENKESSKHPLDVRASS